MAMPESTFLCWVNVSRLGTADEVNAYIIKEAKDVYKRQGHTHQLHMAEQGSLGAAGHGGIGPVRKGCHGHADGSAVAGQGDGCLLYTSGLTP